MNTQETTDPDTLQGPVRISTGLPPRALAAQAACALAATGRVYRRDGVVVEIHVDEDGRVHADAMTADDLDSMLAECVEFYRPERPERSVPCPRIARGLILTRAARLRLPAIAGVAHGAVLSADGTLVTEPGYDAVSGYYVEAAADPIIVPPRPTLDDARAARAVLDHVLREFEFARDAHRAGAMAALLTLLARPMIDGYVPNVVTSATKPGSGKTTLLDVIHIIATGRDPEHSEPPSKSDDLAKHVTAVIREQHPFVIFDNLNGSLVSSALAAVTTSKRHRTRRMHTHTTKSATVRTMIAVTGIAVRPSTELARRCVMIRLQSRKGRVGEFAYEVRDVLGHVRERRSELLSAAYTILRHHVVEGIDDVHLAPWNSFESWSQVVRGALVRVGYADPVEAMRTTLDDADVTPALVAALIPWLRRHAEAGRTRIHAQDLADLLLAAEPDADTDALAYLVETALAAEPSTSKGGITPTNMGALLSRIRGAEHNGLTLQSKRSQGRHVWSVVSVDDADDGGGGSPSATFAANVPSVLALAATAANDVLSDAEQVPSAVDVQASVRADGGEPVDDVDGGSTTIGALAGHAHASVTDAVRSFAAAVAANDTVSGVKSPRKSSSRPRKRAATSALVASAIPESDDPRVEITPPEW